MARGIEKEDWDKVIEACANIVNSSLSNRDMLTDCYDDQLFSLLDEMEQKYGKHEDLLATRADFESDFSIKEPLLLEAWEIAKTHQNHLSSVFTISSLAQLYLDRGDFLKFTQSVQEFRMALDLSPEVHEESNYRKWLELCENRAKFDNQVGGD